MDMFRYLKVEKGDYVECVSSVSSRYTIFKVYEVLSVNDSLALADNYSCVDTNPCALFKKVEGPSKVSVHNGEKVIPVKDLIKFLDDSVKYLENIRYRPASLEVLRCV